MRTDISSTSIRTDGAPTMRTRVIERICDLPAAEWNDLDHRGYPFLRHEFLTALEQSGCIGPETGWRPHFIVLEDDVGIAAAAPAWLKDHSYGEFVFDFAWAQAYARHGLRYYPKLLVAAPFTPATGPRLLQRRDSLVGANSAALLEAIAEAADSMSLETAHVLFPDAADLTALRADPDWLLRCDCQFHWQNRGYRDFDDFLATFTAEKRKKARRERRRVTEAGIHFERRFGHDATSEEIERAWQLHRRTFLQRGNEPYLNLDAFKKIAATMGEILQFTFARLGDEIVAVAVFFVGGDTLYGRYWGSAEEYHSLHFETCYHQGIEFCIERGLQRFEPGTQGEHKVSRGFAPTFTWSAHRIVEPRFRAAIADYLAREKIGVEQYAAGIAEHVPYKQDLST
ncbi:MAG: hypothetical protein RLY56_978 [Pseudomonadota bacterium]